MDEMDYSVFLEKVAENEGKIISLLFSLSSHQN